MVQRSLACLVLSLCIAPEMAGAQRTENSVWVGHWTLNRAASHLYGVEVIIKRLPHSYRFDLGGLVFQIGDDGKDYPTTPGRTTSFAPTGTNTWLRVHKRQGKTLDTSTFTLADDAKSFSVHTVAIDDTGTQHMSEETFVRQGKGKGIDGTWRSTKTGVITAQSVDIELVSGRDLRFSYRDQRMSFVTSLNGSAVSFTGAGAVDGLRIRVSRVSSSLLRWTDVVNDRAFMEGTYHLSSGGRHLTEESWHIRNEKTKDEAVYDRQ